MRRTWKEISLTNPNVLSRYLHHIRSEEVKTITNNQDGLSAGRDMNTEPPDNKLAVALQRVQRYLM
jgi:hypothetical protein